MATEAIKQILTDHSVEYMEVNGYIVALEYWTGTNDQKGINFIDVTDFSIKQMMDFLGY